MAVPFDVEHLELKGEPISVVQDVLQFPDSGLRNSAFHP